MLRISLRRVHFYLPLLLPLFSLFFDSLALFCHPLPFLMPSPSPARATSLLYSADQSGNYARWQREHNVCGGGIAHALRQVDAELRGLDPRG